MRICVISQYYLPDINGDVVRLTLSLDLLASLGHQVTLITAFPHLDRRNRKFHLLPRVEMIGSLRVIRTPVLPLPQGGGLSRVLSYLSFAISASIAARMVRGADLIWSFSQRIFSVLPGEVLSMKTRGLLVADVTDVWPEAIINTEYLSKGPMYGLANMICNAAYRRCDAITTLNPSMKEMLVSRHALPSQNVVVVPNSREKVGKLSQRETKTKEPLRIVYSGNLGPNYDFQVVLDAAEELSGTSDVLVVIRGTGELEQALSKQISGRKLSNVTLETRRLDDAELDTFLARSDVFLLPMKRCPFPNASFPIKMIDYLRHGKPVICLAEGFTRSLVEESGSGIGLEPGDWEGLARVIRSIARGSYDIATMGERALSLFNDEFTLDKMCSGLKTLLEEHDDSCEAAVDPGREER